MDVYPDQRWTWPGSQTRILERDVTHGLVVSAWVNNHVLRFKIKLD